MKTKYEQHLLAVEMVSEYRTTGMQWLARIDWI